MSSEKIKPPWEPGGFNPPQPKVYEAPPELRLIDGTVEELEEEGKIGKRMNGEALGLTAQSPDRIAQRTCSNLTPKMKARRDAFIDQYLIDFNGPAAYTRATGIVSTAAKMSNQYLREPYVQRRIAEVMSILDHEKVYSNGLVVARLIEESNYHGLGASHGARVSALLGVARIKGMFTDNVHVKKDVTVRGGVMLVPVSSPQEWGSMAEQAQKQLKATVKE